MPGRFESRPWLFCPVCGRPRTETDSRPTPKTLPPSALLRRGWTRLIAEDAAGRVALPCSPDATAWSLLGAGNRALDAGSDRWVAWLDHVTDILAERHGGVDIQAYNRNPSRSKAEVIAVAVEATRRAGIGSVGG